MADDDPIVGAFDAGGVAIRLAVDDLDDLSAGGGQDVDSLVHTSKAADSDVDPVVAVIGLGGLAGGARVVSQPRSGVEVDVLHRDPVDGVGSRERPSEPQGIVGVHTARLYA